ncbi:MAG: HEPN domain-containing protein [bacterium]|nr:HEPN domain-containing protein [bacterium]
MNDDYIHQWLVKANNDLKTAAHELALPEEETVTDSVCFHCQQAVEKYLKAFLIFHNIEIERTHDIAYLVKQCSSIDNDFANIEIKELSSFGVDIRYPDDFYIPDLEEAKFYYQLANQIKKLVLTKLGIKKG